MLIACVQTQTQCYAIVVRESETNKNETFVSRTKTYFGYWDLNLHIVKREKILIHQDRQR